MKEKLLHFTVGLFLITFISCSKDEVTQENSCNRIVEVFDYLANETPHYRSRETITYDENGRVKSKEYGGYRGVEGWAKAEFTYYKDSVVVKAKNLGKDVSDTYYLDHSGRILRTKKFNYDFKYDSDGYLVGYQQPAIFLSGDTTYTPFSLRYDNGNLVEVVDIKYAEETMAFEYYNEPNQDLAGYNSPLVLGQVLLPPNLYCLIQNGFFGKQSKNLMKNGSFVGRYRTDDLKYKKDAVGRITEIVENYSFKYPCVL